MQLSLETRPTHIVTFPKLFDDRFVDALRQLMELLPLEKSALEKVENAWRFLYRGIEAYAYPRFGMIAIRLNDLEVEALRMAGFIVEPNAYLKLAAPCGTGVVGGRSWALDAMNIGGAAPTGAGIPVAILDSGLDLAHPDFLDAAGNSRVASDDKRCFLPGERADDIQDDLGHGTHCAGSIFGVDRTGAYRYAVAPGIRPIIGKVIDDNRKTSVDVLTAALDWAASRGAKVISMSLGQLRAKRANPPDHWERMANRLFDEDRFLVAAVGNDGHEVPVESPAACVRIMAVSALVRDAPRLRSQCNGALDSIGLVDICAPGTSICSAKHTGDYVVLEGTSMATAHVAGLAALYWEKLQAVPRAVVTATAVWNAILSNADRITTAQPNRTLADYGSGRARLR